MRYTIFAVCVLTIFTIFVTVFAASASGKEVRVLPKWVWVLVCLLVPAVGGILYLTLGRPIASSSEPTEYGFGKSKRNGTRVVAPDDDPEFLKNLSQRLKKQKDEDPNEQP
jgi:hypothetical protein